MMKADEYSIAHIAVAVPGLAEALQSLEKTLDLKASVHSEEVPEQKVKLRFMEIGGVRFEFLEPLHESSPISKFLTKRGAGVHHIALYVKNLDVKLVELKAKGISLIDETPRVGAENCRIAFIHPKSTAGILIELIEKV
jgi:methylmalonyl-CoA/ethylmalonyl-CoA epimerase